PAQDARRTRTRFHAVPEEGAREAGGAAPEGRAAAPGRQRGLLRRREEAQRDLPAGPAGSDAGDPGRNRFRPGHRHAQGGRRRRQPDALAGARFPGDHPLPAPARVPPAGRGARAGRPRHARERRAGAGRGAGNARLCLGARPDRAGGRSVGRSALLASLKACFEALPAERVEALALGPARRAALADALADGLPGARAEAWKYTSLRALANRRFEPADAAVAAADPALVADIPAPRLVFVNGVFAAALSDASGLPGGPELQPFSQVLAEGHPRDAAVLGRRFERADEAFARFNAALAVDGVRLAVPAGVSLDAPLHLVFLGAPDDGDRAWHLRHLIELGKGARATVVEH